MSKLALAFFSVGALCGLAGMIFGAIMGGSENFTLMPAHAHLNLVGWASLALMGTFYALSGRGGRLGWTNFALSALAVVVMIPSLAFYLLGNKAADVGVMLGSLLAILGMLTFVASVLMHWSRPKAALAE